MPIAFPVPMTAVGPFPVAAIAAWCTEALCRPHSRGAHVSAAQVARQLIGGILCRHATGLHGQPQRPEHAPANGVGQHGAPATRQRQRRTQLHRPRLQHLLRAGVLGPSREAWHPSQGRAAEGSILPHATVCRCPLRKPGLFPMRGWRRHLRIQCRLLVLLLMLRMLLQTMHWRWGWHSRVCAVVGPRCSPLRSRLFRSSSLGTIVPGAASARVGPRRLLEGHGRRQRPGADAADGAAPRVTARRACRPAGRRTLPGRRRDAGTGRLHGAAAGQTLVRRRRPLRHERRRGSPRGRRRRGLSGRRRRHPVLVLLHRLLRAAAGVSGAAAAAAALGGSAAAVPQLPLLPVLRLLRLPLVQRRLLSRGRITLYLLAAGWGRLRDPLDLQLCEGVFGGAILGATARAQIAAILLDAIIAEEAYLVPARRHAQASQRSPARLAW